MARLFDLNFFTRFISALVMTSVFIFCVLKGGFFFSLMILLITCLSYFEWFSMILSKSDEKNDLQIKKKIGFWGLIGSLLILPFSISMLYLRFGDYMKEKSSIYLRFENYGQDQRSIVAIFFIVLILASTDIGAYIFGRIIGGPKIWPKISPNKTISGSLAALVVSSSSGILFCAYYYGFASSFLKIILISILLSVLAQIGGFIMSFLKRHFGVKDSGKLIPGHGGILDRIDSYFLALPVFVILVIFKLF
jgi:CDP-diglyceride synthetase